MTKSTKPPIHSALYCGLWTVACGLFLGCTKSSGPPAPAPVKMSIASVTGMEGNSGTTPFVFRVTLDAPAVSEATVKYNVFEGSAKGGEDFTAATGTLRFAPGESEKTITVSVRADEVREGDESFTVSLTEPTGGSVAGGFGTGTITNDDTKIRVASTGFDAPTAYPGYRLVWSDEFSGTGLNTSDWTVEGGDGCPNLCGWGNNELEFYTGRPENLFFQDGHLVIEARKEAYNGRQYTSSKIVTRGKRSFKFGRIDIRAQLPKGKGIWPAFWMLPQREVFGGWPRSGEIDIMEYLGHDTARTYGTVHYGPGPGSIQSGRGYDLSSGSFPGAFHVFSLEWEEDSIRWLIDGVEFHRVTRNSITANYPFNEEFFLIFNLAVGGNWPGAPDTTTEFPQFLVVDYVRVYQK